MLNRFKHHLLDDLKIGNEEKVLLAVSGGIDSMVMADLFVKSGIRIGIAHINHNTRMGASDEDAAFVKAYAKSMDVPFHSKKLVKIESGNFQSIARSQRYEFLESLEYDFIATGHHQDDKIETILINFLNGRSLSGISNQGKRIRPLLIFTRAEIEAYAEKYQINHINDESNRSTDYLRNFLRLEILPQILENDVNVGSKILSISEQYQRMEKELELTSAKKIVPVQNGNIVSIDKEQLLKSKSVLLLFYALRKYGFNMSQSEDIQKDLASIGNIYLTESHKLLIDRDHLLISKLTADNSSQLSIVINQIPLAFEFKKKRIHFEKVDVVPSEVKDSETYVPWHLLGETIVVRSWNEGDKFQPYGMDGKTQKLKKYFVESRIDRFTKEDIPIFLNGDEIFWVGGLRTDNRYRWDISSDYFLKVSLSDITSS